MSNELLTDIEAFLSETGMSEYRFGYLAARNGRLVERLRAKTTAERGKPVRVWPETEEKVRDFIAREREQRREVSA